MAHDCADWVGKEAERVRSRALFVSLLRRLEALPAALLSKLVAFAPSLLLV